MLELVGNQLPYPGIKESRYRHLPGTTDEFLS
jgi:hypothetical protein